MEKLRKLMPSLVCLGMLTTSWLAASAQSKVVLETRKGKHRITRNDKPYFIRGAGGEKQLDLLKSLGGNSTRIWGADNLSTMLDEAASHGVTVCAGLWLGHERHGFDYSDAEAVKQQKDNCLDAIRKHKDHPALLIWAIGNEMEADGKNPAVWKAIDDIARECKQIDPNHPTMTVLNEISDIKVQSIQQYCPHIDIVGINSYGGITSLAERYLAAGGKRPYIVTEHGPYGPWEVGKTEWGAPIEQTSTAKSELYATGYQKAVTDQKYLCLGSYAFLWGDKQETTATWFGMLLPDGARLAAVDVMSEAWTGKPPQNRCPRIESLELDGTNQPKPGSQVKATLVADDPEQDPLKVEWVLRFDSVTIGAGGDAQAEERTFADAVSADGMSATVKVPTGGGGYRLFAYVYDGQGGAAVANVPLYVDAPKAEETARKAKLPFTVYADGMQGSPYTPSGYMGKTAAIRMTADSTDNPHSGKTCLQVEYQATDEWGGVLWQSPPNDWEGAQPGGFDLTGAGELELWVRGAQGGEIVTFVIGSTNGAGPYSDTASAEEKDVILTTEWQKVTIPLADKDLTRIKTGFGWSLSGQDQPVKFFLDDVRYVGP